MIKNLFIVLCVLSMTACYSKRVEKKEVQVAPSREVVIDREPSGVVVEKHHHHHD